jgi:hypothetical protein
MGKGKSSFPSATIGQPDAFSHANGCPGDPRDGECSKQFMRTGQRRYLVSMVTEPGMGRSE